MKRITNATSLEHSPLLVLCGWSCAVPFAVVGVVRLELRGALAVVGVVRWNCAVLHQQL